MSAAGLKYDGGKVRAGLVLGGFSRALTEVGKVGMFGAEKYTDDGWISVPDGVRRYTDAMLRHYLAENVGEDVDPESGLMHAAHLAWNALARLDLMLRPRVAPRAEGAKADEAGRGGSLMRRARSTLEQRTKAAFDAAMRRYRRQLARAERRRVEARAEQKRRARRRRRAETSRARDATKHRRARLRRLAVVMPDGMRHVHPKGCPCFDCTYGTKQEPRPDLEHSIGIA